MNLSVNYQLLISDQIYFQKDIRKEGFLFMYKIIGYYKRKDGIEEFAEELKNTLIPRILKIKGVIKVEVTDLMVSNSSPTDVTPDNDFALMCEIYFASPDALQKVLASEEGQAVAQSWINDAADYLVAYVGKEEVYRANLFTNLNY